MTRIARDAPRAQVELAATYAKYQELMAREGNIDFGDQIVLALRLLRERPHVLNVYQRRFKYILVDEFQDTNYAQFELVKLLAARHRNVAVVADDDQAIYRWRGAAISNVLGFLEHYPGARQVVLTENFRSHQAVLDAAYRLIDYNNPDRLEVRSGIDKRLTAVREPPGPEPHHLHFETATQEADAVAQMIRERVEQGRGASPTSPCSCAPTTTPTSSCARSTCAASRGPSRATPGSTAGPRCGCSSRSCAPWRTPTTR